MVRGPKPAAALRELGVQNALNVPEPNTWREILQLFDQNKETMPLNDRRVAIQEHGVPSPELYAGLTGRGAEVFRLRRYFRQTGAGGDGPSARPAARLF